MSTKIYPTNSDAVIDSRDVIEAIEELESQLEELPASGTEPDSDERADLIDELAPLKAFAVQASEVSDWPYGEQFVRDDYFEDFARQLAEDCAGDRTESEMIRNDGRGEHWPFTFCTIDWEAAAEALKGDYTPYEFDGVTYWARA